MILGKLAVMRLILRALIGTSALAILTVQAYADSELVIAIRYLQAEGTSHSHLYLYREDGKLLRQLTNDNSGQDSAPIFSPDGETIVFTREKPKNVREFWNVKPRGTDLKKLDTAPDWYTQAKSSPYFTNVEPEQSNSPTTNTSPTESGSPTPRANLQIAGWFLRIDSAGRSERRGRPDQRPGSWKTFCVARYENRDGN